MLIHGVQAALVASNPNHTYQISHVLCYTPKANPQYSESYIITRFWHGNPKKFREVRGTNLNQLVKKITSSQEEFEKFSMYNELDKEYERLLKVRDKLKYKLHFIRNLS